MDSLELQLVRAWRRYAEHLAGRHNQKSHGGRNSKSSNGTAKKNFTSKAVNAVNSYLGTKVSAKNISVLSKDEFDKRFGDDSQLHGGVAAIRTDDGNIYIKQGFEGDAIHELAHQAGMLENGVGTFVNEGVTQAAAKRIAKAQGTTVRDTYDKEVNFVEKYILPTVGIPEQEFFAGYAKAPDKAQYIADLVFNKHGDKFSDVDEWGSGAKAKFKKDIAENLGTSIYLSYLVDEVGV